MSQFSGRDSIQTVTLMIGQFSISVKAPDLTFWPSTVAALVPILLECSLALIEMPTDSNVLIISGI